jgi:pyridoxine kinase
MPKLPDVALPERNAADYSLRCIEVTRPDPDHWYGVKFEPVLGEFIRMLEA